MFFFIDYLISRPFVWGYNIKTSAQEYLSSTIGTITTMPLCIYAGYVAFGWAFIWGILATIAGFIALFIIAGVMSYLWYEYCDDTFQKYVHKVELFFMPTVYLRRNKAHHKISFYTASKFDAEKTYIHQIDTRYPVDKEFFKSDLYIKLDSDGKRLIRKWIKGGFIKLNNAR